MHARSRPAPALAALAACAEAEREEGTEALGFGDSIIIRIDDDVSSLDIECDVKVTAGPAVDVSFMGQSGYDEFSDPASGTFAYYATYSVQGTKRAHKDRTWSEKGTFYVTIVNSASSVRTRPSPARPSGTRPP